MELLKVIIFLIIVAAGIGKDSMMVIDLNDDNFEEQLKLYENLLILFYAPNCHHSQKLLPLLDDAASQISSSNS